MGTSRYDMTTLHVFGFLDLLDPVFAELLPHSHLRLLTKRHPGSKYNIGVFIWATNSDVDQETGNDPPTFDIARN